MRDLAAYLQAVRQNLAAGNATEHTHRPALKSLIESLAPGVTATNEPRRIECGAPDFVIGRNGLTLGYVEAKDVGRSLGEIERGEQMKRYRQALPNLILTDYLEFRWYVDGDLRDTTRLAQLDVNGKVKSARDGAQAVEALLLAFLDCQPQPVNTPQNLAMRMARLAHMIRDVIIAAFERDEASPLLQGWRQAFAQVLIADLDRPDKTADFADMLAQTLAYGLFTARTMDTTPGDFTRAEAQRLIPRSNPFLRDFFYQVTGPQLDDEPFAPFVDDLVNLLRHTDMAAVLADFGRRTRQQDPVVHFYETFLAAYDPALRESRGVYYTPEPVVSYIVRSVDHLLKTRFNCPQGLADSSTMAIPNYDPGLTHKGKRTKRKTAESHRVLILDPACGTGTFLYAVIDHIRQQFMDAGNAGMWAGYVQNHLLPRIFGFELLMAPYAVAHFKLALQLAGHDLPDDQRAAWAYHPGDDERLGVYLTNALEGPHEYTGLPLFTQWVADETNEANRIKEHLPVMVVLGNPPYSNFGQMNQGEWIRGQIEEYKRNLDEKKLNLDDDFIKFIRFGQWRIEKSGSGVLAFITNNTYVDGITHRRMRQSLMETFSAIYILNLHGSMMRSEKCPDGSLDENVFDIRQGVAIGLFIKEENRQRSQVNYADLWGTREAKYTTLSETDVSTTRWTELNPQANWWFFVPRNIDCAEEYQRGQSLTQIFQTFGNGIGTDRDKLFYDYDRNTLVQRITIFYSKEGITPPFSENYRVQDSSSYPLLARRENTSFDDSMLRLCLYRPFDTRWLYYDPGLTSRSAYDVMQHLLEPNSALLVTRQISTGKFRHVLASKQIVDRDPLSLATRERTQAFPIYRYPVDDNLRQKNLFDTSTCPPGPGGRTPNLNPQFIQDLARRLGLAFTPDGSGDLVAAFGPEDVFHYIYAVLHSPTYRERYAEFLKIDFPRVPLTADLDLFRALCALGRELVALHLMESPALGQLVTRYPVPGDNRVEKGYPIYTGADRRVHINKTQYFEGVAPEVLAFQIGGYQVLDKWLKDRRERQLSFDDLLHYQRVVVALQETIRLMDEIDATIPEWPME